MFYYIDMDGVLVKYDRSAYDGDNPRYLRKNEHYYRDLAPDVRMQAVVTELAANPENKLYILTSVTNNGDLYAEHVGDKIAWLNKYLPVIDTDLQFIATISPKRDIIMALHNPNLNSLTNQHILIDDFNRNLTGWRDAGGTAIKYCNGLNNPDSYDGLHISATATSDEIVDMLTVLDSMKGL